ncbi:MAG: hypothetical protein ACOYU5_04685 [Stygiobacter sp.]
MASKSQLDNLKKIIDGIRAIDREKLLRASLGEESLQTKFGSDLEQLEKRIEFALEYAPLVNDNTVSQVASILNDIKNQMDAQAKRNNAEYVAQKNGFLSTIESYFESLLQHWPPFITAAIELRGFLQDEGIKKEYQNAIQTMRDEATSTLKLIKEESEKTIEEAKKLAQQIEERARKTAAHISVETAQEQFREAQKDHKKQVRLWAILSSISILAFIITAIYLASVKYPEQWQWHVIYYTAIRITILTAVGAIAAFCLKILRANMHMSAHNLHRQRVANSLAAFVESAVTPEQRDLILAHLVDSIATFGNSGLLKEEDSIYSPKMTIDTITRNILPTQSKSS